MGQALTQECPIQCFYFEGYTYWNPESIIMTSLHHTLMPMQIIERCAWLIVVFAYLLFKSKGIVLSIGLCQRLPRIMKPLWQHKSDPVGNTESEIDDMLSHWDTSASAPLRVLIKLYSKEIFWLLATMMNDCRLCITAYSALQLWDYPHP